MSKNILEKHRELKEELGHPEVEVGKREDIEGYVIVVYLLRDRNTGEVVNDVEEIKKIAESFSLDFLKDYSNERTHLVFR